jgi:hypothetical protein
MVTSGQSSTGVNHFRVLLLSYGMGKMTHVESLELKTKTTLVMENSDLENY